MHLQRIALAGNGMFTGGVEVELGQVIRFAVDDDVAATADVDLNGMAVVDDIDGRLPILKGDIRQIGRRGVGQIDRRLLLADATRFIAGAQFSPLFRPVFAFILEVRVNDHALRRLGRSDNIQQHVVRLIHQQPLFADKRLLVDEFTVAQLEVVNELGRGLGCVMPDARKVDATEIKEPDHDPSPGRGWNIGRVARGFRRSGHFVGRPCFLRCGCNLHKLFGWSRFFCGRRLFHCARFLDSGGLTFIRP